MATALVVVALLLALGFTAAGVSTSSLNLASRAVNAQSARNVAEAAVSEAAAELLKTPTFAQDVTVKFPGATGNLTFDKNGRLYSTNNLDSDSSTPGWGGTVVPAQAVHLVGLGECGGVEQRIEAVIFFSRYPFAVASSGSVVSDGGLQVAAVDDPADAEVLEERRPGAVGSNAGIELDGPGIEVTGDLQAVGAIKLGPQAKVSGEKRAHSDAVVLPRIDVTRYDTAGKPDVVEMTQSSFAEAQTLTGYSRSGPVTFEKGLVLDNGVLYVDGDLTVHGGISGTGAVIVTGTTTVEGGAAASGQTALLSRGDVTLRGLPGAYQAFQGLIYTEGNLESRYLKLNGVFLANNAEGSTVRLDDTRVLQTPINGVDFPVTTSPAAPTPPPTSSAVGALMTVSTSMASADAVATLHLDPTKLVWDGSQWQLPNPPTGAMIWQLSANFSGPAPAVQNGSELAPYLSQVGASPTFGQNLWTQSLPYILEEANKQMNSVPPPAGSTPTPPPDGGTPGGTATTRWTLDLSQFLLEQDRMRVLLWRDF